MSLSSYSLLDGFGTPEQIVQRCIDLGRKAVSLTDHDNVFVHPLLQKVCAKNNIKSILGCEMRLVDDIKDNQRAKGHLTVLAKSYEGYVNLMKLLTMAWSDGCFYYKPTIDKRMLFESSNGLIVLSGCPSGSLSRKILDNDTAGAMKLVSEFKNVFGDDYYLEVMAHDMDETDVIAPMIRALSNKYDIKCVLTNDEHFLEKGQERLQKILWCIRDRETLRNHTMETLPTLYYMSDDDMLTQVNRNLGKFFSSSEISELFNNQERIASDCNTTIPKAEFLKYGVADPYAELRSKAIDGLNIKGLIDNKEYTDRIEKELDLVNIKNFSNYFLVVADIVNWAKDNSILVGPSRGSSACSLLAYCVGITEVDPVRFGLPMERFMSEDRVDPPDIDVDFQDSRRQEVIDYMSERFKSSNVAQLATVVKFKGKNTLGELGKVFEIPPSDIKAVQNTLIYRCLPAGTDVIIDGGIPPKKIEDVKIGDKVLSYNFDNGNKESDVVSNVWTTIVDGIRHFKTSNNNELICSKDHKIYTTNRGWLKASDINIGDKFIQYRYFGLSNRLRLGKKCEDFLGEKKAKRYKDKTSKSHKGNKPYNAGKTLKEIHGEYSDIVKYLGGKAAEGNIPWNKGLTKETDQRLFDISNLIKDLWKDPDYAIRCLSAKMASVSPPNGEEMELMDLIDNICHGEFRYNGDARLGVFIANHVPDFVNVNGKKKLIEYNGCYWHGCKRCGYEEFNFNNGKDAKKIKDYKDLGWDCLTVWGHELRNKKKLEKKIETFLYNPNVEIVEVIDVSNNWYLKDKEGVWDLPRRDGLYSIWHDKGAFCIKKCNDIIFMSLSSDEANKRYDELLTDQTMMMYDIEVEKNHNFFAYGILLSNSSADARSSATIEDTFKMFPVAQKVAEQYPDILDAKYFEGQIRHTSVHAAGIVVSDHPLWESTAIMRRNGTNVAMLTGESHSVLGLLKMDILGLDYLSILKDLCEQTGIDHFSLYSLPIDDKEVFNVFNGSTVGIFQFNEASTYSVGKQLGVSTFNDIVLATSLSRPGPLHCVAGNMVVYDCDKNKLVRMDVAAVNGIKNTLSLYPDGSIKPAKVKGIFSTGKQQVYSLRLKQGGRKILASAEHRFMTSDGWKQLKDILPGDKVAITHKDIWHKSLSKDDIKQRMGGLFAEGQTPWNKGKDWPEMSTIRKEQWEKGVYDDVETGLMKKLKDPEWAKQNAIHASEKAKEKYDAMSDEEKKEFLKPWIDAGSLHGYGEMSYASDGHFCLSRNESIFEEWLIKHNIDHIPHPNIGNGMRKADQLIKGLYIEIDGMDRNDDYWKEKYKDDDRFLVIKCPCGIDEDQLENELGFVLEPVMNHNWESIFMFEVDSISPVGIVDTYDMEIENTHNYMVEGFVSHNSGNTQLITETKRAGSIKRWNLDIMNEITKDTYGYVVFQEQVIRIMHEIGGMEWKDVSAIRSAMSKSLGDEYFNTFRDKFVTGSGKLFGISPEYANTIFDHTSTFGSWAFNKAHAVGYSLISYWTAYFKAHYPRVFYKVLCDHAKSTEKLREYLREYKEKGYGNVLPPKINKSGMMWSVEGNDIRAGLTTLLPEGASSVICGIYPITSMNDLQERAPRRKVNSRIISMIEQYDMFSDNDSLDPFGLYAFAERLSYTPRNAKIGDLGYNFEGRTVTIAGVLNEQINLKSISELKATQKLKDWSKRFNEDAGEEWAIITLVDDSGGVMHCHVKNYLYPKYKDMLWSKIVGEDVLIVSGYVPGSTNYMIVKDIQEWNDRKAVDAKCYKCSLIENDFCPPSGNPDAKIVFVGMCPGRDEIAQKKPFVGKAGRLLNGILDELHVDREKDLWVTNSALCRPVDGDKNVDPNELELDCCSERLKAEIKIANPKVVVTFGKVAYFAVTGENPKSITEIAGTKIAMENYILIPAIHPAAALRPENEKYIPIIKDCIKQAIEEVGLFA